MESWQEIGANEVPADIQRLVTGLLAEADQAGCCCDPEVRIPVLLPGEAGRALVIHEPHCPLCGSLRLPRPVPGVGTHFAVGRPAEWN